MLCVRRKFVSKRKWRNEVQGQNFNHGRSPHRKDRLRIASGPSPEDSFLLPISRKRQCWAWEAYVLLFHCRGTGNDGDAMGSNVFQVRIPSLKTKTTLTGERRLASRPASGGCLLWRPSCSSFSCDTGCRSRGLWSNESCLQTRGRLLEAVEVDQDWNCTER